LSDSTLHCQVIEADVPNNTRRMTT